MNNNIKGFTLVEVIVVVAVLAAVLTIAMPDVNRLFSKQKEIIESFRLKEIHTALDIYAKKNRTLPDASTWYEDIVEFSELSSEQIRTDVWGNDRHYRTFSTTKSYLGGSYTVNFAVVVSNGKNGVAEASLPNNVADFGNFDFTTTSAQFGAVDDLAIKYTDQSNKIKLLETTINRMNKLSMALERYARVMQISGITTHPQSYNDYIYFPNDGSGSGGGGIYYPGGEDESSPPIKYDGVENITTYGSANDATALAKFLGLPEEYGQNALDDSPMWYISNPGPDGGAICAGSRSSAPFYPPVIMIADSNPC